MAIITKKIKVTSKGEGDILNITDDVQNAVSETSLNNGTVTVFVTGSTGSVSTIEYEPGLLQDVPRVLNNIAPAEDTYEHNKTWGCDNGRSHVKATLMGPSLTVPFVDKQLTLGTWQQICFLELDTRGRNRELVLQIIGE